MHYVVCVKMVPDTTQVIIDPVTNTLVREGVPFITNPFDNHAVEEALRLKEKYGSHVTAISMAPPAADAVLKKASVIGVACPYCMTMFEDGLKDEKASDQVAVKDIAEIVAERLA